MSVHAELISPIICEYIILFEMCEPRNEFPYAPYWYDVPVTTQGNFKHYRPFKKHNKTRLK
jgi:hypothetical protein